MVATRNAHKLGEIRRLLSDVCHCLPLPEPAPELPENGTTFEENARLKAHGLASWLLSDPGTSIQPDAVLADDSGLEVDALGGAPGVRSARFAAADLEVAGNAPDAANNAKLLELLAAHGEHRSARFRCVVAFTRLRPGFPTQIFEGVCEGRIAASPRGEHGFGYDPLFIPEGRQESFAELGEDVKNQISHRARALARLRESLRNTAR